MKNTSDQVILQKVMYYLSIRYLNRDNMHMLSEVIDAI